MCFLAIVVDLHKGSVETPVCCCGTEITFVFPDNMEREPIKKQLPGKEE